MSSIHPADGNRYFLIQRFRGIGTTILITRGLPCPLYLQDVRQPRSSVFQRYANVEEGGAELPDGIPVCAQTHTPCHFRIPAYFEAPCVNHGIFSSQHGLSEPLTTAHNTPDSCVKRRGQAHQLAHCNRTSINRTLRTWEFCVGFILIFADVDLHPAPPSWICEALHTTWAAEHAAGWSPIEPYVDQVEFSTQTHANAVTSLPSGQALHINPKEGVYYFNLGNLAFGQEKYTDAIEWYEVAVALDPRNHEFEAGLATAYMELEEHEQAGFSLTGSGLLVVQRDRWSPIGAGRQHRISPISTVSCPPSVTSQRPSTRRLPHHAIGSPPTANHVGLSLVINHGTE